ncbi:helix-turn-helix transcriptional regulator [Halomonas sp. MCCC 1A11062]|uniref:helix-turn-helix domain-containing protein n=1 Tax=Halomonas sp. MCCC 1A11062 TaxID=2733485 RepID=UPI001F1D728C|nr:helix-turn-helix transcriptional regulator [Halomonas sp. MCCC 1A11062]MCE8037381.1 helix-turn-helix transcriptional regulator [Halomonas sp. MCCC 1A11062]
MRISLLTASDVQHDLAKAVRRRRRELKLSRHALAERSGVPAPTIKRFESTGQISLRQFLLLWQSVDQLERLAALSATPPSTPQSIEEVLRDA